MGDDRFCVNDGVRRRAWVNKKRSVGRFFAFIKEKSVHTTIDKGEEMHV